VKQPVVYILASKPYGTLYIGVTSNLSDRVEAHRNGCVDGFTKQYGVHTEETQEVEPRVEDQADRGDESRVERPFRAGFLNSLNWVPAPD
jgi:putative endonuclease